MLFDYSSIVSNLKTPLLGLAIIFSVFTALLIYVFISNGIDLKQKEIGILRSLGLSRFNILKIYIIQNMLICLVVTINSSFSTIFMINKFNEIIGKSLGEEISFIYLNLKLILFSIIYIIIIMLLSSYLPLNI